MNRVALGARATLAVSAVSAVLAVSACNPTSTPDVPGAGGTSTTPSTPAPVVDPTGLLAQLVVADGEGSDDDDNRGEWGKNWAMHPGGCSTRELVLLNQSAGKAREGRGCAPVCPTHDANGAVLPPCWTSPYDGRPTHRERDLQIDHRVSVAEAARSLVVGTGPAGEPAVSAALAWTPEQKHAFYEDQQNLVAVTAAVNQAKADLDPGRGWRPARKSAWCDFATGYARTKVTWGLSVDQAEYDGLDLMFATCGADR